MRIRRDHTLGKDEARRRVDRIAGELNTKFKLRSNWDGDNLKFTGSGVTGRIGVGDRSIEVDVRLGFSLVLLEPTIRSSIENALDKYLK